MTTGRTLERLRDVAADVTALWAGGVQAVGVRRPAHADGAVAEFVVVPSAGRPRMLVQTGSRRAAATAFLRLSDSVGPRARAARVALAAAAGSGVGELAFRDRLAVVPTEGSTPGPSLLAELATTFGSGVLIALAVGAVRANRKPVLHVLDRSGRSLGYAKLALSPLAGTLVERERANLERLGAAGLRHIELPRVVRHGTWNTAPLLVISPLAAPLRRHRTAGRLPVTAMRELAQVDGTEETPLAATAFWQEITTTAERCAQGDDAGPAGRFAEIVADITRSYADTSVTLGCWHGDWGPWNMASTSAGVRLWDWERFASGVPLGVDALHFALQPLPGSVTPATAREATDRAYTALRAFGVAGDDVPVTLLLYLALVGARYVADSRTEHGAQLRATVASLVDLMASLVAGSGGVRGATAPGIGGRR